MYCIIFGKTSAIVYDCRPKEDFECSNIKVEACPCGNIPEDLIASGLSANALGQKLEGDNKQLWDERNKVETIILLDWSTTKATVAISKLKVVKEMMEKVSFL